MKVTVKDKQKRLKQESREERKEQIKAFSGFRWSCRKESKYIFKLFVQLEGSRAFPCAVIEVRLYSQLSSKTKSHKGEWP